MEEEIYILIDRYMSGELAETERKVFEDRMKDDPDFAEKANLYMSLSRNLASRFSGENDLQQFRKNLASVSAKHLQPGDGAKVISLKWYHWAAAASVALICLALFYGNSSTAPTYAGYAVHEPLALAERGEDPLRRQAEEAFNSKNYDRALEYFNRLLEVDPANVELQLYKGITLMELDYTGQAESIFESIKDANEVYKDKALWYLALSALKREDYNQCRDYLLQIPKDADHYDQASEILDDL
jgi:tetratricopeptide (TPR) repeat protein